MDLVEEQADSGYLRLGGADESLHEEEGNANHDQPYIRSGSRSSVLSNNSLLEDIALTEEKLNQVHRMRASGQMDIASVDFSASSTMKSHYHRK